MDGILVGSYLTQPIHFTMRADMFRKPVARFCLKELHVSPVYRIEEGFGNVHKNVEAFNAIYDILKKHGNFIMFSEGICVQEKRLQKLRKGTARIAFGADEKFGLDINIVPVGINYTYPSSFRKEVMINFHDSFSIKELKDLYKENPAKALRMFNEKCEEGLRKEVIIIEDTDNDWIAEQLLKMGRNDMILPFFRWRFISDERRIMEKTLADKINYLSNELPGQLESLKGKVHSYTERLKSSNLKDENIARKLNWGWLRYIAVIAGLPVFIAGYISNLLPFLVPKLLSDGLIKDLRFYSSVYVSSGTALYLIYFPVVLILATVFFGWIGLLAGLLVPVLGYLALYYQEIFRERLNTLKYTVKSLIGKTAITELKNRREEIQNILNNIKIF